VSESQTRTCYDGSWSRWSGSFTEDFCTVSAPRSCDGGVHGSSQQRTRWAAATVPAGSSCQSELQTRSCYDGNWSPWSGTYTAESCHMRGQSCNDYSTTPTTVVLDGDTQSRTRYEVAFPLDSCAAQTQTRQCSNGTFGAWSGTYISEGCAVRPAPSANVVSCMNLISGSVPYCNEYRGTGDLSVYQSGCTGVWSSNRGCPTGGTSTGRCSYGSATLAVSQSFYAVIPSFDPHATCTQQGGTWANP
jgi:hypothetical protein